MLQKDRKTSADSEFCERQRNVFVTGGNNLFFVGCDMLDKRQYKIHCPGWGVKSNSITAKIQIFSKISLVMTPI